MGNEYEKCLALWRKKMGRHKLKSWWNMHAYLFNWQRLPRVHKAGCRNTQLLIYYSEIVKNILESKVRKIWYTLLLVMFSNGKRERDREREREDLQQHSLLEKKKPRKHKFPSNEG